MAGILYVVATPIGNLEDLTFRAKRILGEVGLIAAEDTRRTAKLLAHYAIRKPVISVREHNEAREAGRVIARLEEGVDVALVSDAGTPGIADPGARLVRAVLNHELRVMPIPGPSAITAALSVSGMDASQFVFMGFPPRKGTDRETWFIDLAAESRTVVFFEAPHRIERTLAQVESIKRPIVVIKEISKINELLVKSHNCYILNSIVPLGEFAVVVAGNTAAVHPSSPASNTARLAMELYDLLTVDHGIPQALATELVAYRHGIPPNRVRVIIKKFKILVKQQT